MEYPNLTKQESAELQEYLSTHQDDLLTHIVQFNELMRKYQAATKEITGPGVLGKSKIRERCEENEQICT